MTSRPHHPPPHAALASQHHSLPQHSQTAHHPLRHTPAPRDETRVDGTAALANREREDGDAAIQGMASELVGECHDQADKYELLRHPHLAAFFRDYAHYLEDTYLK